MGTDVFLLTKPAGSNSIQRACSQAMNTHANMMGFISKFSPENVRNAVIKLQNYKIVWGEHPQTPTTTLAIL
jgi:hypothetical protein